MVVEEKKGVKLLHSENDVTASTHFKALNLFLRLVPVFVFAANARTPLGMECNFEKENLRESKRDFFPLSFFLISL